MLKSTIGQILVNDTLPAEYRDYDRRLTKDAADDLLAEIARKDPAKYREISHELLGLGSETSFLEGMTLRLSDLETPIDKSDILRHVDEQEKAIMQDKSLNETEKKQVLSKIYSDVHDMIKKQTYAAALKKNNPFAIQVKSKARGNPEQLSALMSTPGVYQNARDEIVPVFIRNSYAEGLEPHEYWAATYGARKGVISTKLSTRSAGALGKQLGTAVSDLVISGNDCETPYGIPVPAADEDNVGSVLARPAENYPAGTVLREETLTDLKSKDVDEIAIRSPITCSYHEGICKKCAGQREDGKFPEIGHHLGLNAASALAERVAQGSLNQKHSGGQAGNREKDEVYGGFDVINSLANIPKTFPHRATVSEVAGKVEKIEPAAQGGSNVWIEGKSHYVPPELRVEVKEGAAIERGDALSGGIVNPADIVKYKGIGEGRRYFAERFTKAFRESGNKAHRRNVEPLARAIIDHVAISDMEGEGNFMPGEIVSYNSLAKAYRPRPDARMKNTNQAVGGYLDQPALHYSIGTHLTKKMAATLDKHGIKSVMVSDKAPSFEPGMVSATKVPEHWNDWMARLGSTYLQSRLLQDVQQGSESKPGGLHPIPTIATGKTISQNKR